MWAMDHQPEQRPEGKLIAAAQRRSALSQRQAAERAGVSEATWRNITSGSKTVAKGVRVPIEGPAVTVARMAQVVGVTPDELGEAGRGDAAEELRALPPLKDEPPEPTVEELHERIAVLEAREAERIAEMVEIRRALDELRPTEERRHASDGNGA